MGKNRTKRRAVLGQRQGSDLVFLAGLPRNTLNWILDILSKDTSKKHLTFDGAPSIKDDWKNFYSQSTLGNIQGIIGARIAKDSSGPIPTPRRILILYVPSRGVDLLIEKFGIACYLEPLVPMSSNRSFSNSLAWRHERKDTLDMVSDAIQRATIATNALKVEITDKSRSALSLPPRNFYFPNRESLVYRTYLSIARQETSTQELNDVLKTVKIDRDRLAAKALKSTGNNNRLFRDLRGRIFPPNIDHAPNRIADASGNGIEREPERGGKSEILGVLHQRYRFGVVARDGNLHYDVQYESPRRLSREPMYCVKRGNVLVTGSHANVGINDSIWVPGGNKESANNN